MAKQQKNETAGLQEEPEVEGELLEKASPEPVAEAAELADADVLQQEIEALRKQAQESLDMAVRAQAELDNVRKRTLRDVENAHKYALEKFVIELLPVIDSLELGINAALGNDGPQGLLEGMELTLKKFLDVLGKFGVEEVKSEGEKFDPGKHEAVSMQEQEEAEPGTVITVLQKGYGLNGRLIRPAMVIVAK